MLARVAARGADRAGALEPGTMVGEYRVDRALGAGAFGAVYAGEQPLIGKKVAIKVLHRELSSDPEVVSRFVAEARAVNRIRHRNIIDIFSFGQIDGQHYFVMELLDGLTLQELLDREGRLGVARALPILRGIADGLDAAHEAGVTHRDLKPENVFLAAQKDGSYFPKLLDFGVAKLVTEDRAHRTGTGIAIGTPRYMAPEQTRGKNVDHRADVYALGVVIHEALTGRPPFDGTSVMDVLIKHATDPPPPMSSVRADLPPELDAPVLAMLAKRANARPSSAGGAVAALVEVARSLGLDREEAPGAPAPVPGRSAARGAPARARAAVGTTVKKPAAGRAERVEHVTRAEHATRAERRAQQSAPEPPVTVRARGAARDDEDDDDDEADDPQEDVASAPTLEVQSPARSGTVMEGPLLVEAAQPGGAGATVVSSEAPAPAPTTAPAAMTTTMPSPTAAPAALDPPRASRAAPPRADRPWVLIALAAAGVALGAIALLRSGAGPAPAAAPSAVDAPPSALPSSAPTADAPPPLVVPSAVLAAPPTSTGPDVGAPDAAAPASKTPRKPTVHKDLDKPPELARPGSRGSP